MKQKNAMTTSKEYLCYKTNKTVNKTSIRDLFNGAFYENS